MAGKHVVTCAEYCGKGHSDMQAKVTVDMPTRISPSGWRRAATEWMITYAGGMGQDPVGAKGCTSCHTFDGSTSKGPTWKGIWGKHGETE